MPGKLFFSLLYWFRNPPWDTGITPPEVHRFLEGHPPGTALDLGCGTGTNVITLAEQGWQASGIDFVPRAIRSARRKAHRAGMEGSTSFRVGNVLEPGALKGEYDLVLDIGCFHSFGGGDVIRYARNVSGVIKPGGSLLLYAHLREEPGLGHGATESDLKALEKHLTLVQRQDGEEGSRPSAWLEYRK